MAQRMQSLLAGLQLARVGLMYTAIANIWLVVLLGIDESRVAAWRGPSIAWRLGCAAVVAAGLYVFGMCLNDILDVRRDRTFAPQRPLPSGRISYAAAISLALMALMAATAASVGLGSHSSLLTMVCGGMILFYNALGKAVPWVGILTLGLIRAIHMLIGDPSLAYAWPVWLTMTHIIGITAAAYALEAKRPALTSRDTWLIAGGWAFVTLLLIGLMNYRHGLVGADPAWRWAPPTVAAAVFIAWAWRTVAGAPSEKQAGGELMRIGLLWLIVYDAAWLIGSRLWWQASLVASLLPAAWLTMALIRQLKIAVTTPPGFAREP